MKTKQRYVIMVVLTMVVSMLSGTIFYQISSRIQGEYIERQSGQIEYLNGEIRVIVEDVITNIQQDDTWKLPASYEYSAKDKAESMKTLVDSRILFYGYTDTVRCRCSANKGTIHVCVETFPLVWRDKTSKVDIEITTDYKLTQKKETLLTEEEYYSNGMKTIKENTIAVGILTAIVLVVMETTILVVKKKKT